MTTETQTDLTAIDTSGTSLRGAPLTKRQQRLITDILSAKAAEPDLLRAVQHKTHDKVRRAMERGIPAPILAAVLDVSRARVYQMKDQADAFDATKAPQSPETG